MSDATGKGRTPLGPEDRARMARLYEEVKGRLEEMALIVSRTLHLPDSGDALAVFHPRPVKPGERMPVDIEIICHGNVCGCYDYRDGTCGPC
ncbi:hypothetical protein [Limnoglobus roseus]|uniref:Uncharacterized protein n=1 Tax=Limnoglobus roseus TaxID=2598579 RepID=A0A5C1ACI0_9BACT|nr:hypothetical protein [Limnoglobus roseus]QEL16450.1 hypothetical protein PX52LOC_03404 [Limnoglobus roseus]